VEELWYVIGGRGQVWRAADGGEEIVDVEAGSRRQVSPDGPVQ
jgi:mannose-6-phosphate isomerase-like protein (cupin superfamily)